MCFCFTELCASETAAAVGMRLELGALGFVVGSLRKKVHSPRH